MTDKEKILAAINGVAEREVETFLSGGWVATDPKFANEIGKRVASAIHAEQYNMRSICK